MSEATDKDQLLSWRITNMEAMINDHSTRLRQIETQVSALEQWRDEDATRRDRLEDKLDGIQRWLVGIMGSLILALVLLIVNLSTGKVAAPTHMQQTK